MPDDRQRLVELLIGLNNQTNRAIWRIWNDRSLTRPFVLGTDKLLWAIASCRTGYAKTLLADQSVDHDPDLIESHQEYKNADSIITSEAERVLVKAIKTARGNGDSYVSNDHLLLALLDTPRTCSLSIMERERVDEGLLRIKLRHHLGLDGGLRSNVQAYEWCSRIERDLAFAIIRVLKRIYGEEEWWVKGVPLDVRRDCVLRMEEEGCALAKESYFQLIDYRKIAKSNWSHFKQASIEKKEKALSWLLGINAIRNAVMHPAKRDITAEDIESLKEAYNVTQKYLAKLEEIKIPKDEESLGDK